MAVLNTESSKNVEAWAKIINNYTTLKEIEAVISKFSKRLDSGFADLEFCSDFFIAAIKDFTSIT